MYEPQWVCEGKGSEEMKALKRAHIMILATVFTLLVGGTLAFANGFVGGGNDAHGAVVTTSQHNGANNNSESNTGKTSSDTQQQQQQTSSEPTATTAPVTASTATPSVWAGKIASVDCAKSSITITLDSSGQSATAALTSGTKYSVGSCANLTSGAHVHVEVQSGNAVNIVQDDSGSGSGSGSGGGDGSGSGGNSSSTPTPGGSK